jgi:hypothetical protein
VHCGLRGQRCPSTTMHADSDRTGGHLTGHLPNEINDFGGFLVLSLHSPSRNFPFLL